MSRRPEHRKRTRQDSEMSGISFLSNANMSDVSEENSFDTLTNQNHENTSSQNALNKCRINRGSNGQLLNEDAMRTLASPQDGLDSVRVINETCTSSTSSTSRQPSTENTSRKRLHSSSSQYSINSTNVDRQVSNKSSFSNRPVSWNLIDDGEGCEESLSYYINPINGNNERDITTSIPLTNGPSHHPCMSCNASVINSGGRRATVANIDIHQANTLKENLSQNQRRPIHLCTTSPCLHHHSVLSEYQQQQYPNPLPRPRNRTRSESAVLSTQINGDCETDGSLDSHFYFDLNPPNSPTTVDTVVSSNPNGGLHTRVVNRNPVQDISDNSRQTESSDYERVPSPKRNDNCNIFCQAQNCKKCHAIFKKGFYVLVMLNVIFILLNVIGLPVVYVLSQIGKIETTPPTFINMTSRFIEMSKLMRHSSEKKIVVEKEMPIAFMELKSDATAKFADEAFKKHDRVIWQSKPKAESTRPTAESVQLFSLTTGNSAILIKEKGYYFVYSRAHFKPKSQPINKTNADSSLECSLNHSVMKILKDAEDKTLDITTQKCYLDELYVDHTSIVQFVEFLKPDEEIYVKLLDNSNNTIISNNDHIFGLFYLPN